MVVAVLWRHAAPLHYSGQGRFGTSVLSAKNKYSGRSVGTSTDSLYRGL